MLMIMYSLRAIMYSLSLQVFCWIVGCYIDTIDLHMLSCLMKLAMLLCLKYKGRISFANLAWSNKWKLVPH